MQPIRILGIPGSLREASFNTRLLETCPEYLPDGSKLEICGIGNLPLYDAALDGDVKPESVEAFRRAIEEADALLFATPEYNYSIPGGLKNAIDWASRPAFQAPLTHKPAGIFTVTRGVLGGVRAQGHLKQILSATLTPVYPSVEFLVGESGTKFDPEGRLTDEKTRERLARYLAGFVPWVRRQTETT